MFIPQKPQHSDCLHVYCTIYYSLNTSVVMICCPDLTSSHTAHAFTQIVQSWSKQKASPLIAAVLSSSRLISILAQHLDYPTKTNSLIELRMSSIIFCCKSLSGMGVCVCLSNLQHRISLSVWPRWLDCNLKPAAFGFCSSSKQPYSLSWGSRHKGSVLVFI